MIDNTEPDNKNLVPITDAEAYRLMAHFATKAGGAEFDGDVNTLADMGIHSTTKWRLAGKCRWHGEQAITLETNEVVPDNALMLCFDCAEVGRTRWLQVDDRTKTDG